MGMPDFKTLIEFPESQFLITVILLNIENAD